MIQLGKLCLANFLLPLRESSADFIMAEDTEDDLSSDAGSDLFTGVKGSSADSADMPPPSPPAAVGDRSCFICYCHEVHSRHVRV